MKLAFLYAGQGSQCEQMGKDLYEAFPAFRAVIDRADPGFDLKKIMFEAPLEKLSQTQYTQPAMAAFAAGVTNVLYENGIIPEYAAGLSLGEYSALYAAGVFDENTLIPLTAFRGRVMQEAAAGQECLMCAILGIDAARTEEIVRQASAAGVVEVANYNTAKQTVIAGAFDAVKQAEALAKEAGAKCRELNVSSAFHTSFMEPASAALKTYLEQLTYGKMRFPVVFNTTALPLQETETVAGLLTQQVKCSVRMSMIIEYLAAQGVDEVIEIGPGKTLAGFVKKTVKGIKVSSVTDTESLKKVLEEYSQKAQGQTGMETACEADAGSAECAGGEKACGDRDRQEKEMRDQPLKNQVAIVTGGGRGIGRAVCIRLAKEGADVVINYAGSKPAAEETLKACEAYGVRAIAVQADVSTQEGCDALFEAALTFGKRVDILVNNAGITRDNLILRMRPEDFDAVINTNLKGVFLCLKKASRLMLKQKYGRIINLSSVVGLRGNAGQVNYSASKAGVIGMTKSLAKELASRKITVNAVAPGMIDTQMTQELPQSAREAMEASIPFGCAGKAEDVANAVCFFAMPESGYVTGQVLCVDGGMAV